MKRNYSTTRVRLATAVLDELQRADGHYPAIKARVHLHFSGDELRQLADVAAAAILDTSTIEVICKHGTPTKTHH